MGHTQWKEGTTCNNVMYWKDCGRNVCVLVELDDVCDECAALIHFIAFICFILHADCGVLVIHHCHHVHCLPNVAELAHDNSISMFHGLLFVNFQSFSHCLFLPGWDNPISNNSLRRDMLCPNLITII